MLITCIFNRKSTYKVDCLIVHEKEDIYIPRIKEMCKVLSLFQKWFPLYTHHHLEWFSMRVYCCVIWKTPKRMYLSDVLPLYQSDHTIVSLSYCHMGNSVIHSITNPANHSLENLLVINNDKLLEVLSYQQGSKRSPCRQKSPSPQGRTLFCRSAMSEWFACHHFIFKYHCFTTFIFTLSSWALALKALGGWPAKNGPYTLMAAPIQSPQIMLLKRANTHRKIKC